MEDGKKAAAVLGVGIGIGTAIYLATRAEAVPGKATLYGLISDATTGNPLPGVRVTLVSLETYTDSDGYYAFINLDTGPYTLTCEKEGYEMVSEDITLKAGDNPLNVAMAPISVVQYTLAVSVAAPAVGYVTKNPDKPTYSVVEIVTLTATLDSWAVGSYEFDHWSGDASGTSPITTITMDRDKVVVAHFVALAASLSGIVTDADTGYALAGVKVSIDGEVDYTDSSGVYAFAGLTPGAYVVTFEKSGYETETR
ncbi:hypothetical protein ES708_02271 [subsurface metagenome]